MFWRTKYKILPIVFQPPKKEIPAKECPICLNNKNDTSDSLLKFFNSTTINLVHLNKMISDTTYNITYIDNEEFSLDIEVESSNHLIRDLLGIDIWYSIEKNMIDCADYKSELCVGSVQEKSIREIWHDQKYTKLRNMHSTG